MKQIIAIVLAAIFLTGCASSYGSSQSSDGRSIPENDGSVTANVVTIEPIAKVWFTSSNMSGVNEDVLPMYPAKVKIGNLHEGSVVDTLIKTEIDKDRPDYALNSGDPIGINIHNPSSDIVVVDLTLENINQVATDADTSLEYSPAPFFCLSWVKLSSSIVSIPPYSIAHVPIKLTVPKNISGLIIPNKWEFRIRAAKETTDKYTTDTLQRWLISMR